MAKILAMIMARRSVIPALLIGLGLSGCLSLPEPPPSTAPSAVGDPAPVFTLARTGPTPGTVALDELWRDKAVVLVFYRGEW